MKKLVRVLSTIALCVTTAFAAAQSFPSKPIHLIVPFAPGGSTDGVARALAQRVQESTGQMVIVENRAGAGGTIGSSHVAKSRPDGYTLLLGTVSTNAVAASLFEKLPYDPIKSFTPITEIASVPELLVVHPSVPASSVKEFVDYVKARPGKLAFASAGPGTASHLAAELFMLMTGTEMTHVPYKGSGPALQDTLGNHTQAMFDVVMTSHGHIKAGKLKGLGVTSSTRSKVMPDIPTIAEAGVPGYEALVWFGVFGPADMPAELAQKLHREFSAALQAPKVQELLAGQGAEVVGSTPSNFAAKIRSETTKWAKVVKDANVSVN